MNFIIEKIFRYRNPIKYWKDKGLIIGKGCEVYSSASFGSEPYLISIGDNVRINSGVNFVTHDGGCWVLRNYIKCDNSHQLDLFGTIKIGSNVHIGTNSIIMPGVSIGDNVIIGCCSVVTRDIPSNSVAVGIPARVIESVDEYYKKHKDEFVYTKHLNQLDKREYLLQLFRSKSL